MFSLIRRNLSYVQGQYRAKTREYFYFIDHQGMLFMDDVRIKNFTSCFKDQKFLHFFFTRVKPNETGFYDREFPYVSPCGRELNYIRCDDLPIVFTKIIQPSQELIWAHVPNLTIPFDPAKIYMSNQGRIYHPFNKHPYVGLIASKVGMEISNNFQFENNVPTGFRWDGEVFKLSNECEELLKKYRVHDVREY